MDIEFEKCLNKSRALLFGLLVNCIISNDAKERCPLWELRNNLSLEKKYDYVMELSKEKVNSTLVLHEECFNERFPNLMHE
jgi:hypothetical protein